MTAWNDGETWRVREPRGIHQLDPEQRAKWTGSQFDQAPNLEYTATSPTLGAVPSSSDWGPPETVLGGQELFTVVNPYGKYALAITFLGARIASAGAVYDLVHSLDTGENPGLRIGPAQLYGAGQSRARRRHFL